MEYTKETLKLKHFSFNELECPDSKRVVLAEGEFGGEIRCFGTMIDFLREEFGHPMSVNSCCRSKEYNGKIKNAHPRSLHVYDEPHHPTGGCCAVDINTLGMSGEMKAKLVKLALILGFSVGVAKTFIHLDARFIAKLPQTIYSY